MSTKYEINLRCTTLPEFLVCQLPCLSLGQSSQCKDSTSLILAHLSKLEYCIHTDAMKE